MLKKIFNLFLGVFFKIKLIKLLSHKNKIVIFENISKKVFFKVSLTKSANNLLANEKEGYKWYSKLLKEDLKFELKNNFFKKFEIQKFKGFSIDYHNSVIKNNKNIYKVINYYKNNWPRKKIVPVHGDFTFANFIFSPNKKKIFIIDWENFKKSGEPWGFDLVYFFISVAILPNLNQKKINKEEKKELTKIWKKIRRLIKDQNLKKNPIMYIENVFKKKNHWIKLNKMFPSKFFLNKTDKKLLKDLDHLIRGSN